MTAVSVSAAVVVGLDDERGDHAMIDGRIETLIVGAAPHEGAERFYRSLVNSSEFVIACDAAAEWCESLGRVPDLAVGDFDSALPGAVKRLSDVGVPVRLHPAAKDESDLDLALEEARRLNASRVTFTACLSERLDHTLASLGTIARSADLMGHAAEPHIDVWALEGSSRPSLTLKDMTGRTVSLFAVEPCSGITLTEFRYPLDDAELSVTSSLGLSNVVTSPRATIHIRRGRLLVMAPADTEARALDQDDRR